MFHAALVPRRTFAALAADATVVVAAVPTAAVKTGSCEISATTSGGRGRSELVLVAFVS